eukprot:TRINITY_DN13979_c0_g1_i1.p1 TRINITY_DN13979_c0_g1~~TRINITY_DN13979_c0_g1_i1.p1  ORF type:complete len:466 (-),score=36.80 TRINITY_DN13979_c0_g1_i1:214-1611(-)
MYGKSFATTSSTSRSWYGFSDVQNFISNAFTARVASSSVLPVFTKQHAGSLQAPSQPVQVIPTYSKPAHSSSSKPALSAKPALSSFSKPALSASSSPSLLSRLFCCPKILLQIAITLACAMLWLAAFPLFFSFTFVGQPAALRVYEQFETEVEHATLHHIEPYFGVCVASNISFKANLNVDGPSILPVLVDYHSVLWEYAAVLTLGADFKSIQKNTEWIAFEGPSVKTDGSFLKPAALNSFWSQLKTATSISEGVTPSVEAGGTPGSESNDFFYWATHKEQQDMKDLYGTCDGSHGPCTAVISLVFRRIFSGENMNEPGPSPPVGDSNYLPPLPVVENGQWSFYAAFAVHSSVFPSLVHFMRMFLVTLETLYDVRDKPDACPLQNSTPCWVAILDRVVNLWAYHSGRRMIVVDRDTGGLEEMFPLDGRTMWPHMFSDGNITAAYNGFAIRLGEQGLSYFDQLSGL